MSRHNYKTRQIVKFLSRFFACQQDLKGKHVLVTAGPTFEKIDPVRFIGNYSSGKMGYAIAEEAARRGAMVTLISGPVSITTNVQNINVIKVDSAQEMYDYCISSFPICDFAIMSAAVADYAPIEYCDKKIKREKDDIPTIRLKKNPDIAAKLGSIKKDGQMLIGFALETNNEENNAIDKLHRKNLDMIILNSLQDSGAGFGTNTNKITIYTKQEEKIEFPLKSKI